MPRNVRNFYLTASIDGRDSTLSGGPVSRDGGISVRIQQRDSGTVTDALRVHGFADESGTLTLIVYNAAGDEIGRHATAR